MSKSTLDKTFFFSAKLLLIELQHRNFYKMDKLFLKKAVFLLLILVFNAGFARNNAEYSFSHSKNDTISSAEIKQIIEKYIVALENKSPFDESIEKLEIGLLKFYQDGKYQSIKTAKKLAEVLSNDIIKLTGDYHFGIDFNPDLYSALTSGENSQNNEDALFLEEEEKNNFFIHSIKYLNNGFFYFKIDQMPRILHSKNLVDSLMLEASKAKGLVIDLRDNTGGAGSFNRYLLSYFLPSKTMLFERVFKYSVENIFTVKATYNLNILRTFKIYVLVNENTVSAGEQLAYILQNHERATIIGKTTFGAAHGSIDVPLSNSLIGLVPVAYEKHIKTKKDWETSGVKPDIISDSNNFEDLMKIIDKNISKNK